MGFKKSEKTIKKRKINITKDKLLKAIEILDQEIHKAEEKLKNHK